jgi:hypothetical protein
MPDGGGFWQPASARPAIMNASAALVNFLSEDRVITAASSSA